MQSSFTVSPMIQKISLKAGETFSGKILVANPAEATENFSFKVSLSPYSVSKDDYEVDFENMSDWSQIVEWTTLGVEKGTLRPNETKEIPFTITVPEDAPAGGQYLMIGVITDDAAEGSASAVQSVYEMGSLVFAEIEGETVREGEITENILPGFVAVGLPSTKIVAENNGNIHETVTTKITIKNSLTGEVYKLTDDGENTYDTLVMPKTTRTITRGLEGLPKLGIFELTQSVSYLGEDFENSTTMIICPIWFIALIFALIISIIGMIGYGAHLRHKKARKMDEPTELDN